MRMHAPFSGLILSVALSVCLQADENWPQWRGPNGNGTSAATNLPTTWSLIENIVWKTPLPHWSGGTPII